MKMLCACRVSRYIKVDMSTYMLVDLEESCLSCKMCTNVCTHGPIAVYQVLINVEPAFVSTQILSSAVGLRPGLQENHSPMHMSS